MIQQLADMYDTWPTMHRARCCTDKMDTSCIQSLPSIIHSHSTLYVIILAQDYPDLITQICTETTALLALLRYNTMLLSVQEYRGW